ncbi:hypothetical protein Q3G72_024531 [Acer saccharum]|nr:hypothetical protein Q3G72_024531 [Acer saccharum]
MEKNELSRIPDPDPDEVVSPDNPDDPNDPVVTTDDPNDPNDPVVTTDNPDDLNDPVVTTDDPNDPATDAARRRNIEMEKNEQSRIADPDGPDIVVSPDDPNDPVVTTDDPNTCDLVTNTLKEIRSTCAFVTKTLKEIRAEQEKASVASTYVSSLVTPDMDRIMPEAPVPRPPEVKIEDKNSFNERVAPKVKLNSGNNTDLEADPEADSETDSETAYGYYSREIHIIINQLKKFLEGASLKNIHEPKQGEHVRDSPTAGDQNQEEHVRGTAGDQKQGEHVRDSPTAGDQNQGEHVRGTAGDQKQGEHVRDSPTAGDQNQGEHVRGTAGDQKQGEHVRDSPTAGDQNQGEHASKDVKSESHS